MGTVLGLLLGTGALLVWQVLTEPPTAEPAKGAGLADRVRRQLAEAGIQGVSPGALLASCVGAGLVGGLAMYAVSRVLPIALTFAVLLGYCPVALVRSRSRARRRELADQRPEVVDNLASAVRAGLSLPEALAQIGSRGPAPLRPAFAQFADDYLATGRFAFCLDRLKLALADPVGDRVVEALRIAREVGGGDLGRMLRSLSAFLREDARTRSELEARQAWAVNGARLAVAAPCLVLGMLSLQPEVVGRYDSLAGTVVLAGGAVTCLVAYRLMVRLGRVPVEERVLR